MAQIETVRGPVDTAGLGATLMHEHVFVLTTEINANWPERSWGGAKETRIAEAVATLKELKGRGIDSIVDLTAVGLGPSIPDVQLVNASVDINIVVATGLYTFDELPTFFASRRPKGSDDDVMVDMFVEDIEEIGR